MRARAFQGAAPNAFQHRVLSAGSAGGRQRARTQLQPCLPAAAASTAGGRGPPLQVAGPEFVSAMGLVQPNSWGFPLPFSPPVMES